MKRKVFAALALGTALIISSADAGDPVAAIVNGKQIKVSDVMAEMRGLDLGKDAPQDQIYKLILNRLVELMLIKIEAGTDPEKDPEIQKALEKFKERLFVQYVVAREIKKAVTDATIQKAYKDLPPQKEVKLRHILVKDENTAKSIIKALKSGADFATLAKSKSIDETTGKKGGELDVYLESRLPPPFARAVEGLKPKGFTETPVKSQMGWHVFMVESRTDAPFEAVAPMIRENLEKEALTQFIESLKKKAKIELFDQEGKPLKEAEPTTPPPAQAAPAS